MKQIEVVAAIIRKGDKIFATQRGYGEWQDWWEFPGGKMEAGETPEEALKREIREELSTEISVDEFSVRWSMTIRSWPMAEPAHARKTQNRFWSSLAQPQPST